MSQKMTIFAKVSVGFDFPKMFIFEPFLISFSSSFLKNEIQNEIKMSQKWLLRTTLLINSHDSKLLRK